ncbi:hypothetical protein PVAND_003190 [Polypedilum vanderplanki]|uniref:Uncharacterized protein n=1 Tax=Polypedilum vanderplanki TaxID=319348 RepID=A0A9J6BTB2_POLVA|nr:hypothetical protein PVAND_003190 [Polypedilum vanderplanki]
MDFTSFLIFFMCLNFTIAANEKKIENYVEGYRFKSVSCWADNETIATKYCYIKAVSRIVTTLNIGVKILKAFRKPYYVRLILSYRYGTITRPVIDTKEQEWCGAMNGENIHLFMQMTITQIQRTASKLFHKCPYDESDIDIQNVTIEDSKALSVFNSGIYQGNVTVTKNTKIAFQVITLGEVKSHIRDSFGRK